MKKRLLYALVGLSPLAFSGFAILYAADVQQYVDVPLDGLGAMYRDVHSSAAQHEKSTTPSDGCAVQQVSDISAFSAVEFDGSYAFIADAGAAP